MYKLKEAASCFLYKNQNLGHYERETSGDPVNDLIAGLESGRIVSSSILKLVKKNNISVLDVGCSWGAVAFGAAAVERVYKVTGIDVEEEAIILAREIVCSNILDVRIAGKTVFIVSPAEKLPFENEKFDLVICHTVLEHVNDVEKVIKEMYRVLKPGGLIYLEAPNYVWPYEPHIQMWMPPMGPKWMVKFIARIRGIENYNFINHLNFISPFKIEKILRDNTISYKNLSLDKLEDILIGQNYERIIGLTKFIPFIKFLHKIGAARLIYYIATKSAFYPSMEYIITK